MSSFLQKLRGKGVVETDSGTDPAVAQSASPAGVSQLPVDVYQSDREIVIYAQIPGTDVSKLDVSIEGENDVITIQGEQRRPEELGTSVDVQEDSSHEHHGGDGEVQIHIGSSPTHKELDGEFSFEECLWGQFFRQIILPQEVDPGRAAAKVKDGVLVLHLPLKEPADNRIKMKIVKLDHN
jgi:HSP20 family molecular chaperone IbpA